MKVIKNINNNVSLCLDNNNVEVIAFGKGIGFVKPPYEVDLRKVTRTYYDVDPIYVSMINSIPEKIFDISDKVVNYARSVLENPVSSNIVFTLADHINFAIDRFTKNMVIQLPIANDVEYMYEKEVAVGRYAVSLIRKELNINLPNNEACFIALHIVNAESKSKKTTNNIEEEVIDHIVQIIEKDFDLKVDKKDFNYSRFVSHVNYLLKRGKENTMINTQNSKLYEHLKSTYTKTYECSQHIREYLYSRLNMKLSDEECLYLMLHINRLCLRVNFNQ